MPNTTTSILTSTPKKFNLIENYIYMYHLLDEKGNGTFVVLPTTPDSITDNLSSTFSSTSILSRTAPIFSYSNSGPRTIQINLTLHRDMMTQINYGVSNLKVELGDDYVDTIIKRLQACALPSYLSAERMVNPPLVAVRFANDIFIKGVINGGVMVTYEMPLLSNNKYAVVKIGFQVSEVDPYDAVTVANQGSMRGLSRTLERNLFKGVK